jgi:hypothetical protein
VRYGGTRNLLDLDVEFTRNRHLRRV